MQTRRNNLQESLSELASWAWRCCYCAGLQMCVLEVHVGTGGGMCRHDKVDKGISAAVEAGLSSSGNQGGAENTGVKWNQVWPRGRCLWWNSQKWLSARVITAFVSDTENRWDVCFRLLGTGQLLAAAGICPKVHFLLSETGCGWSEHAPLHPICAAVLPWHYSCPKPSVSSMANMSFSFSCS